MTATVILAFLRRVPWQLWGLLLAALVLIGTYWLGKSHEASEWEARWAAQEATYAAERKAATEAARKTEERHRAEYKAIAERFLAEQRKADEEHAAIVAGLRAGTVRVRERFRCPAAAGMPDAAGNPGSPAEAGPRGFGEADAAVALGIARDADEIARRLNALQEAVRAGQSR